ncbi:MAG: SCO family protein [Acidobacteriaceae bacterium]
MLLASGVSGCKRSVNTQSSAGVSQASTQVKTYPVRGKVLGTDASTGTITLDGEAIPGFMDAMVMPYKLKQPNILSELHPGDKITATLYTTDQGDYLDQIVIVAQGKLDYKPTGIYHVPQAGDLVPDFKLLNQSDKTIHLHQYKGKVLLVTFIYTRCPLSDYCPRMSRYFAEINSTLKKDPRLYARTHLLSISFDPVYDKPAVLRSYGEAYTGNYTKSTFQHWEFAAPSKEDLSEVTHYFDVGVTPGQNGTLTHSLSTVVIGPDSKVVAWYPTNEWKPADILNHVKQTLEAKAS